jgi:APA family basic amino acid/polyamine antiporter
MNVDLKTNERPQLKQTIGRLGFFSLAFGSMIGVGWITGLHGMFQQAGPVGTMIAFVAGGLLMIAIGLCYAQAMQILPVTGGEVAYAYKAFGTGKAFIVGWCLAIGYLSVSAFEAVSIGVVISYLIDINAWPLYEIEGTIVYGSHVLLAFLFTGAIALINYLGVGLATRIQTGLTILLICFAAAFVTAGCSQGELSNLKPVFGNSETVTALAGILAVFVTVPFWFVGFDTIPQAAEERAENFPASRLGKLLILAIAGSTIFYVLVFLSVGMTTPWTEIVNEDLPTAAAFRVAFGSPFWERIVLFVGLIGLLTSWNGFFLSGCRVLFAMGRGNIIHPAFAKTHPKYGTPTTAIIFSASVTFLGALIGKHAITLFVNVGSFCIALAFLGVAFSLPKIKQDSNIKSSLLNRLVPLIAGVGSGFILLAMITPGSPAMLSWPTEWGVLGLVLLGGFILWLMSKKVREDVSEESRRMLILNEQK